MFCILSLWVESVAELNRSLSCREAKRTKMLDGLLGRGFASKWFYLRSMFSRFRFYLLLFFCLDEWMFYVFCGAFFFRSKSLIKMMKTRIDVIRRKRKATQKFLRKDIADLLSNGLDTNAYGRVIDFFLLLIFCYFSFVACD